MKRILTILSVISILLLQVACKKQVESGDTNKPFIQIIGENPVWIKKGQTYTDKGAKAWDVLQNGDTINISPALKVINDVNTEIIGVYYVKYNVSDETGNRADQQIRKVYINNF